MIYNTYEPYGEDNNIELNNIKNNCSFNYNECFICMESSIYEKLIELKNINNFIKNYSKNCKCNSLIHLKCLNDWINVKSVCPICRIKLIEINVINRNNINDNQNLNLITIIINRNIIYTGISKVIFIGLWIIIIIYIFVISFNVEDKIIHNYNPQKNNTVIVNNSSINNIFNHSKYYN